MAALDIPNLDFAKLQNKWNKGTPVSSSSLERYKVTGINDFLHTFLHKVAALNPMWRYEAISATGVGDDFCLEVYDVEVFEKRESVGRITKERNYNRREDVYCLTNKRIHGARARGSWIKTANEAKALSVVKKYFSVPKPDEVLDELINGVMGAKVRIRAARRNTEVLVDYPILERRQEVRQFLWDRWDEFLTTIDTPKDHEINMLEHAAQFTMLDTMTSEALGEHMYSVAVVDSRCYVRFKGVVQVVDSSDLPEHLRGKLGMLKLVEVGQAIDGVGFKSADDAYLIMGENNDVQS
jgi:hypothetical protein